MTTKGKKSYWKNPEKARETVRRWRRNNPERKREIDRKARRKLKFLAFEAYGGMECKSCGTKEPDFLCLDHINNDGARCRREHGSGNTFFAWLKANGYPDIGLQILCYNCNNYKKINGKLP
jgi:hypothetical protein